MAAASTNDIPSAAFIHGRLGGSSHIIAPRSSVIQAVAPQPGALPGSQSNDVATGISGVGVGSLASVVLASAAATGRKHLRRRSRLLSQRTKLRQAVAGTVKPVADEEEAAEEGWGEKFNWQKQWYPMAVIQDLDGGRPTKLQLLGEDLVAWKDGDGEWRVFEDRCPHRNVPLSEGRVEKDGTLMCSYHGWRFNGEGKIAALPQAKDEDFQRLVSNPRACAASRPTQIKEGVLWVWGETNKDAALEAALVEPILPAELSDPELEVEGRVSTSVWSHRDIPYGWEVAMENVTDPAHVDVAHHNIISNRYEDPAPLSINMVRKPKNQGGFKFEITKKHKGKKKKQLEGVISTMDFRPPCAMHIKSEFPSGASLTLLINFVPIKPGWSRLVGSTMLVKGRNGEKPPGFALFSNPLPRWIVHLMAPAFLHQDQVFLHHQQSILQKQGLKTGDSWKESYWIPCEADNGTVNLRRWLDKNDGIAWSPAASTDLSALPDKQLLFDTYKTHTAQCTTCQKALKRVSNIGSAFKYAAIISASAGVASASLPCVACGAAFGLGAGVASKLKGMFHEMPFHHQDNN